MPMQTTGTANGADEPEDDFFPEETVDEQQAAKERELAQAEERAESSEDENRDLYEDPHGSMYAGPLATSVPTSMTAMRRRSRSKSQLARSDVESDAASAVYLARNRSKSNRRPSSRRSRSARSSRRGSVSSAASRDDLIQIGSRRDIPATAIESASESGSEDEEGGKKPKKRGMLSAWFGSTPKRPSMERASSSASFISGNSRKSGTSKAKKRKPHKRQHSTVSGLRNERGETEAEEEPSSDEIDENDPYELYGSSSSSLSTATTSTASGSGGSSDDNRSRKGRRRSGTGGAAGSLFLPSFGGAGGDQFFGDNRIEGEEGDGTDAESSDDEPFFLDEITKIRQTIYIADEDLQLLFEGWGEKTYKTILWTAGVFLSFGILSLLGKWVPEWWLNGRGEVREFGRASKVVVKTSHGTTYVVPIKKLTFQAPVAISTVFPSTSLPPPTSRNEVLDESEVVFPANGNANGNGIANGGDTEANGATNGHTKQPGRQSGYNTPADQGSLRSGKEAKLKEYMYVDFRYYRFLLHPISGNFYMSR